MKKTLFLILILMAVSVGNAQTFNRQASLNIQVTENTIIYPFDGDRVTGIGVSGNVCFTSEMGFVRFVVCDNYGDEYLVYESYRLFEQDSTFSFSQKCEESCFYYNYVPTEFKIYVKDAVVTVNSVDMSSTDYPDAENRRTFAARDADNLKLAAVQNYISENGLIWVADHTKLSDLSYSEKVMMLGEGFETYGYEYYSMGVYSLFGPDHAGGIPHKTGQYVANFDWRNRHGANNPNSPYFDDDLEDGTGWISPLTCQDGCWKDGILTCSTRQECEEMEGEYRSVNTCWIFSATACVEAMANLYYNRHLDLDLAEQYISCEENSLMEGGQIPQALNHYKQEGVPYESEWPYIASLDSCDVYPEPIERVRIFDYSNDAASNLENLQQALITRGPAAVGFNRHALLLIGWGTIDETTHSVLGYPENDHSASGFYGLTYLIYKDSFGQTSDPNNGRTTGYVYTLYQNSFNHTYQVVSPIIVPGMSDDSVRCDDKDGDGYFYWGVGPKPAHCHSCPDEPDGDDSNPALGPMNEYGQCTIIDTYNSNFENGWDGWVQDKIGTFNDNGKDWWRHTGPTATNLTGPTSAQDGEYYIYVDGTTNPNLNTPAIVVSPPIDFSNIGSCGYYVDFYYHMMAPYNNAELYLFLKEKGVTHPTMKKICDSNAGFEWQHYTMYVDSDIEQIGFCGNVDLGADYPDIAIDNITIRPLVHNETQTVITGDIIWDKNSFGTNSIINNDIIIEDGAKLTVTNGGSGTITLKMHPDSKIIVKPGGKLILDGCELDCACDDSMWQGIEVWGDASQHQCVTNGRYLQGYLEMKNHSTIKNAICAVRLYDPDRPNASTGGIIHAEDSYFINNANSVHAKDYICHNPNGNELPYNATFKNCKFEINESYSGVHTFYKHVDLANVTGVRFHGCDFSIEEEDGGGSGGGAVRIDNVSYWSEGIAAYNAGFTVDGIYREHLHNGLPYLEKPSTFSGFHAGAYSVRDGAGGPKTFTVKDCEFRNNDFGVFAIEPNFATVLNSTFTVGRDGSRTCNAGVFINSSEHFLIEENTFTKGDNAVEGNNYGVIVKDYEDANELYRNTFEGLYCGNIAVGKNRVNVNEYASGLTYGCNENDGNEIDFYVDSRTTDGIQREQGSMAVPAGNTFSDDAGYHFYNEGIYVDYYYNPEADGATPDESRLYRVYPHSTTSLNECPSHYGGVNVTVTPVMPPAERQMAERRFNESRNIYNSLKEVYENRIDGGNTTGTVSEVRAARPEDMWELRSRLLDISPYLSEDVIYAAADRDDVLPASVLFEILISNPDELKNDTLVDYMANKNTPLPDYMIDILREVAGGTSARTVLLSNMARYSHEAEFAAGDIIRSIMNDSIIDRDDLVTWLGNLQNPGADRDIISIYMAEGNFNDAFILANMLPSLYNLEGDELEDHSDYIQLLTMYRTLAQDGRTAMQLTDAEKNLVEDIADSGRGTSQAMAQSLLKAVYGEFDEDCPQTSAAPAIRGGGKTTYTEEDINRALGLSVKANPNPANIRVTIDYTLPEGFNDAVITLTNSLGLAVYTQTVHGLQGQDVIDTRELPVGVYVLTIRCEDHSLTEKVVVAR